MHGREKRGKDIQGVLGRLGTQREELVERELEGGRGPLGGAGFWRRWERSRSRGEVEAFVQRRGHPFLESG